MDKKQGKVEVNVSGKSHLPQDTKKIRVEKGGMSLIYFVDDRTAVKVLDADPEPDYYALVQELEVATLLDPHPNIARTKSVYWPPRRAPELSMDRAPCSLWRWMQATPRWRQKRGLPEFRISMFKGLAFQSLSAMAHLHARGLVHRDVKPANFLIKISKQKDPPHLLLIDWSHVSRIGAFGTASLVLTTGSYEYQAPEVLRAWNPKGWTLSRAFAQDMWSLGVTFLFLLCGGQHPMGEGITPQQALKNLPRLFEPQIKTSILSRHGAGHATQTAIRLMQSLLCVDPVKRPTAFQLLDHLTGTRCSNVLSIRPRSVPPPAPKTILNPLLRLACLREMTRYLCPQRDLMAIAKTVQILDDCDAAGLIRRTSVVAPLVLLATTWTACLLSMPARSLMRQCASAYPSLLRSMFCAHAQYSRWFHSMAERLRMRIKTKSPALERILILFALSRSSSEDIPLSLLLELAKGDRQQQWSQEAQLTWDKIKERHWINVYGPLWKQRIEDDLA